MKSIVTTAAAILLAASAFAAETFVADKAHSEAIFQVRHMVSRVSGRFDEFTATINVDRENPTASSVELTIKTPSINTAVGDRDKHLRSADFFEVEKYPDISFKSTSIKPTSKKDVYDVTGAFTMHGVTTNITLPVEFLGFVKDPRGNERAGFAAHTTLNRKDYGIVWNRALDNGGALLSDDVDITVNIEAIKKAPTPPATTEKTSK